MYKNSNLIKKYLCKYGNAFERRGDALYCLVCNQNIVVKDITVSRHVNSNKHKSGLMRNSESKSGTSSAKSTGYKSDYFFELTEFLIAADIPFEKLYNPKCKSFLQKWTKNKTPHPSTLRKFYVPKVHEFNMSLIKNELNNKYLWISIDETKDILNRTLLMLLQEHSKKINTLSIIYYLHNLCLTIS